MPGDALRPRLARGARLRVDHARGATVLLVPERALVLSPTAAATLDLCTGELSVADIATALAARYGASRVPVLTDVRELLEGLARRGVVEMDPAAGSSS